MSHRPKIKRYEVIKAYYEIFPIHKQTWGDMFLKMDKFGCDSMMNQVQKLKAQKEREELEEFRKQSKRKK